MKNAAIEPPAPPRKKILTWCVNRFVSSKPKTLVRSETGSHRVVRLLSSTPVPIPSAELYGKNCSGKLDDIQCWLLGFNGAGVRCRSTIFEAYS